MPLSKVLFSSLTRVFALLAFLSLAVPAQAAEKGGPFGLGVIIGAPSAITAKYRSDANTAIDAGISFDLGRWFLLYGDWLYHWPEAFGAKNEFVAHLTPYLGVGGLIAFSTRSEYDTRRDYYYSDASDSKVALGVRVPFGVEWRPPQFPIGVFAELAPGITIVPATHGFLEGGVGARFYF